MLILLVLFLGSWALAACTGSSDPESQADTTDVDAEPPSVSTSVAPSVITDIAQELALQAGQCWTDLPTPQPSTSVPASPTIAVVDCASARLGLVYGNGCLGFPDGNDVEVVECPGQPDDAWPSTRLIRPVVIQACLPLFEDGVGERFAVSDLAAVEWFPSEALWAQGERRFVCTAQPAGDESGS